MKVIIVLCSIVIVAILSETGNTGNRCVLCRKKKYDSEIFCAECWKT